MVKTDKKLVREILAMAIYATNVINLKLWKKKKISKHQSRKTKLKRERVGNVHHNCQLVFEEIDRLSDYIF